MSFTSCLIRRKFNYNNCILCFQKVVQWFFFTVKGDLVPDTSPSVPTGKVLADRRVAVLDVPPSHRLTRQVNLLRVDLKFPDTSNESPGSLCAPVIHLPVGRNIPKKYGSKGSLHRKNKKGREGQWSVWSFSNTLNHKIYGSLLCSWKQALKISVGVNVLI